MAVNVRLIVGGLLLGLLAIAPRPAILLFASIGALALILKEWSRPVIPGPPVAPSCTDRFTEDKVPATVDYVVIGSGMSGLTCAAVLARCGHRVLVLEQHDRAGGGTHMYDLEGYRFDAGLHYTIPWSGPLLNFAAGPAAPPVEFHLMGEPDGTFDKIVIGNKVPFNIKHQEAHLAELRKMFPAPEDQRALDVFMSISNGVLKSTPIFIFSKFLPLWMQKIVWRLFLGHFAKYSGQTAMEVLEKITSNRELIALICGLWIDTGARPDTGTFFLMASVFRGLPHEGGAYPSGGSELMAASLVHTICAHGGRVLVRVSVEEIVVEDGRATGVRMPSGLFIPATHGVISSAGRVATYGKLVTEETCKQYSIPVTLPFGQSAGFVMVNIGLKGTEKELGLTNVNLWYHPVDPNGDTIAPMQRFLADPMHNDFPCMITFPSVKDRAWAYPGKTTCQILLLGDYNWVSQWSGEPCGARSDDYVAHKNYFRDRAIEILFHHYPQLKGKIDFTDVSTPLSIEHYLAAPAGAAVGLDPAPARYGGDWSVMQHLDSISPIKGLALTGQDTLICGVIMAQVSGLATALRLTGFANSIKFFARSIFHNS